MAADMGFGTLTIGRLGDGNLHCAVVAGEGRNWSDLPLDRMRDEIFSGLKRYGGSFSAGHGIGMAKLDQMRNLKDAGQLSVMRRIKAALDPDDLMNPGKLVPSERNGETA